MTCWRSTALIGPVSLSARSVSIWARLRFAMVDSSGCVDEGADRGLVLAGLLRDLNADGLSVGQPLRRTRLGSGRGRYDFLRLVVLVHEAGLHDAADSGEGRARDGRLDEKTSELQSLMGIPYAV